jgi:DNA polymerase-3 subunit epsilon/CBS domain-containing protein
MVAWDDATPLIALNAVALDTETTGLDPRSARIVEIGAVRIAGGRLDPQSPSYRTLVNPGEPIPPAATAIHGIDQAAVASAPRFEGVWPAFSAYVGQSVLIGHTLAFDLAVLKRECERIGRRFESVRALDIRWLAQLAEPNLAGYALDDLAAWLDVGISGRHSALGDAAAAARIYSALVPRLRDRGIRTAAEAIRRFGDLGPAPDQLDPSLARWSSPGPDGAADAKGRRLDAYPYRQRVGNLMSAPARWVATATTLDAVLERVSRERISSIFVVPDPEGGPMRPERTGIVTERDLLRAIATHGPAVLSAPVERIMSRPLACVSAGTFAYRAIARMNRLNVRHLGVTDEAGDVVGALSARDLLKVHAEAAVELGDEIDQGADVHQLAGAWSKLVPVSAALAQEGLPARNIAAVISTELGELTRRAAVLAEGMVREQGLGDPPCDYAVLVLGSAGRGESLLAMDQDNALVHADDAPADADRWFAALGTCLADILHEVGVPYCKGGVMAKNPQWRGSLGAWRERVAGWVRRSNPQDLLSVDIFFDLHAVHGNADIARRLRDDAFDRAQGEIAFAKLMVEAAGKVAPWRGWFGAIRTEEGRIDLKRTGLFGIVSCARALAICHNVRARSTRERLEAIRALRLGSEDDLDALIEAQGTFLDFILQQQLSDTRSGFPPANSVIVRTLSRRDRRRLRTALRAVDHLGDITRDLIFKS